jgi:hypothetical protein
MQPVVLALPHWLSRKQPRLSQWHQSAGRCHNTTARSLPSVINILLPPAVGRGIVAPGTCVLRGKIPGGGAQMPPLVETSLLIVCIDIIFFAIAIVWGRKWVRRQLVHDRLKEAAWIEKDKLDAQANLNTLIGNIRSGHKKALQVHVFQYQKEFQTCQELWEATTGLVREFKALMPSVDSLPAGRNWGDVIPERFGRFREALFNARDIATHNRPFVHPTAFDAYDKLAKEILTGSILVRELASRDVHSPSRKDYELMAEHVAKVESCNEQLCEVIRGRVSTMYKHSSEYEEQLAEQ